MEKGSACSQAHCFLFKSPPTRVCLNVAGRDLRVEVAGAGAGAGGGHRISANRIQLFRKRLSEKVHATIPKGYCEWFRVHCSSKKFERMA